MKIFFGISVIPKILKTNSEMCHYSISYAVTQLAVSSEFTSQLIMSDKAHSSGCVNKKTVGVGYRKS
jgi:hypothetical protein